MVPGKQEALGLLSIQKDDGGKPERSRWKTKASYSSILTQFNHHWFNQVKRRQGRLLCIPQLSKAHQRSFSTSKSQELNVAKFSLRKTKIPLAFHFQPPPQTSPQFIISSPLQLHISTLICEQAEGQSRDHFQGHVIEGCILHPVQLDPSQDMQLNCFRATDSSASSCQHRRGRPRFLSSWNSVTEAPVHTVGCSA